MKLAAIAFTARGLRLGEGLIGRLEPLGVQMSLCAGFGERSCSAAQWTEQAFAQADALLYLGAAGIAVRCIAPFLKSKLSDPAVLVMDENGRYCISLLSGHAGGANRLAGQVAALCGAEPVITTATDGRGLFAADQWAAENGCALLPKGAIRLVSGALLAGEAVGFSSDFPLEGPLPPGFTASPPPGAPRVWVTCCGRGDGPACLRVVPRAALLGVGCRRGVSAQAIEQALKDFLALHQWEEASLREVCTIDVKRDEAGLLEFCRARGLPLRFFSAAQLAGAPGSFHASPFVQSAVGVDNVCERSAVLGGGQLRLPKFCQNGVTLALALAQVRLTPPRPQAQPARRPGAKVT